MTTLFNSHSGNKCGHSPTTPRIFTPPAAHGNRYDILEDAKHRLVDFYHMPSDYLNHVYYSRTSQRQQRSEAREAILEIGQVLLHYLHLATMQIGFKDAKSGEFKHLSNQFLATKAGIGQKRLERAFSALAKAGYLQVRRRYKLLANGEKLPLTSIKAISPLFLKHLGISDLKLSRCVEHAKKRWQATTNRIQHRLQGIIKKLSPAKKSLPAQITPKTPVLSSEERQQFRQQWIVRWQTQYPSMTVTEIYRLLPLHLRD